MHVGVHHHYVCIDSYTIEFVYGIISFECLMLGCVGATTIETMFVRTEYIHRVR